MGEVRILGLRRDFFQFSAKILVPATRLDSFQSAEYNIIENSAWDRFQGAKTRITPFSAVSVHLNSFFLQNGLKSSILTSV